MQKKNNELKNLIEDTKKKEKIKKETVDKKWIMIIVCISFTISFVFSLISQLTIPNLSLWLGILITLLFVFSFK